jgi:small subunit ribosomal protein S4
VPSRQLKAGDVVKIKPSSLKKPSFQNVSNRLKKQKTPSWLTLDAEKLEGKVVGLPSFEEAAPPAEISSIFEFYSR